MDLELISIVDYTKGDPATNLEGIKPHTYWSNASDESDSSCAWYVNFYYGDVYYNHKSSIYHIWCVRTLEDGMLEWANEDAPVQMTWMDAMEYAESMNEAKEITISEIENIFGYKIKIVKG